MTHCKNLIGPISGQINV